MPSLFNFRKPPPQPENDRQGFYNRPPIPWYWTPRVSGKGDYPFDADGSQRFTRPRLGIDRFMLSPFMQMTADGGARMQRIMTITMAMPWDLISAMAIAKNPFGSVVGNQFEPDSIGTAEFFDLPKQT